MRKRLELTGKKFGKLKVLKFDEVRNGNSFWMCECECGNVTSKAGTHLKSGSTKSCGCLHKEVMSRTKTTHGKYGIRLHVIWRHMKERCYNKNSKDYKNYGAKGIQVCKEWHDFQGFYDWAINNGYADNLTIERKEISKGYNPSNCCWVTKGEQSRNTSQNVWITIEGETKLLTDWSKVSGVKLGTIRWRYNNGYAGKDLIYNGRLKKRE